MKLALIQQTCIPDYRVGFFSSVNERCSVKVIAGTAFFSESIQTPNNLGDWFSGIENRFLWSRKLLWQSPTIRQGVTAEVAVLELNPRILSNWPILLFRYLARRPTIVWGHFFGGRSSGRLRMPLLRNLMVSLAHGVAAYTDSDLEHFAKRYPDKTVRSLQNACIYSDQVLREPSPPSRSIIYVGRLVPKKKVDVLVKSFLQVLENGVDLEMLEVVGDGPEREKLEKLVAQSPYREHVRFHGHLPAGDALFDLYATACYSASPGYAGLSVIQSIARGVPVLVSNGEPHSPEIEACIEGFTAKYVDSATTESWSQALTEIGNQRLPNESEQLTIANFAKERYTFEAMAKNFSDLVAEVASE